MKVEENCICMIIVTESKGGEEGEERREMKKEKEFEMIFKTVDVTQKKEEKNKNSLTCGNL